jgi:hypothetical protein
MVVGHADRAWQRSSIAEQDLGEWESLVANHEAEDFG